MLCPIGQSNEKPPLPALAKWREYVTNEVCLAVVKGRFLKNPGTVEYKVINDTVLYMKEMNK